MLPGTLEPKQITQDSHSDREWQRKFFAMGKCCFYCSAPLTLKTAHKEHKTPRCRGGSNRIQNIVPSCDVCNQTKTWRTDAEFITERERLFAQKSQVSRSIYKPSFSTALEVTNNEPGLLKKVVSERERLSWAWSNPA